MIEESRQIKGKKILSWVLNLVIFLALTISLFILYLFALVSSGAVFPLFQLLCGCFIVAILVSFIAFVVKKKKSFRAALMFVAVMTLIPASPLILKNSGYCWEKQSWLSEEDVVLSFLLEEENKGLKTGRNEVSLENCKVTKKHTNGITRLYDLECNSAQEDSQGSSNKHEYYVSFVSVDTCGKQLEFFGEGFNEKERYEAEIKRNREYWRR